MPHGAQYTGPARKDKDKALPSVWIPPLTPEETATNQEKPSRLVTWPTFGKRCAWLHVLPDARVLQAAPQFGEPRGARHARQALPVRQDPRA